jgi:hypothetical protein
VANSHTTSSPSGEAQDDKTSVDPNTPSQTAATLENPAQQTATSQFINDFSIHQPTQSDQNQPHTWFPDPWPFPTDPYFPWSYQASSLGPTEDWHTDDTMHFEHSHGLDGTHPFHEGTIAYGPYLGQYAPQYHPNQDFFY